MALLQIGTLRHDTQHRRHASVGEPHLVVVHPPELDLPVVCPAHNQRHGRVEVGPVDSPVDRNGDVIVSRQLYRQTLTCRDPPGHASPPRRPGRTGPGCWCAALSGPPVLARQAMNSTAMSVFSFWFLPLPPGPGATDFFLRPEMSQTLTVWSRLAETTMSSLGWNWAHIT